MSIEGFDQLPGTPSLYLLGLVTDVPAVTEEAVALISYPADDPAAGERGEIADPLAPIEE